MRNFEGVITTYTEPEYIEEPCNCDVCKGKKEDKLSGVAGLLAGNALNLEPTEMLRKDRAKARLKEETSGGCCGGGTCHE